VASRKVAWMMHRHGLASAIALALVVAPASAALELTPDNFDNAVSGKSAFVKFLAPW